MIIVARKDITPDQLDHIRERVEALGLRTHVSKGVSRTIIGCIGEEARLADVALLSIPGVDSVHPDPETALSDGDQSLTLAEFGDLMRGLRSFAEAAGRSL